MVHGTNSLQTCCFPVLKICSRPSLVSLSPHVCPLHFSTPLDHLSKLVRYLLYLQTLNSLSLLSRYILILINLFSVAFDNDGGEEDGA